MVAREETYDFQAKENVFKWKEILKVPLEMILKKAHGSLMVHEDALSRVCEHLLRVLNTLLFSFPFLAPHNIAEISEWVRKRLPKTIASGCLLEATANLDTFKGSKKNTCLFLPVEKVHQLLVKDVFNHKFDFHISIFFTSILEYIATDFLKLIGIYVKHIKHQEIHVSDLDVAICADKVLMSMLYEGNDDDEVEVREACHKPLDTLSYDEVVKDLLLEENQYLRELQMILKVFKETILQLLDTEIREEMEGVFDLVSNMYELSSNLIGSLEDTIEATKENETALVGMTFDEFMEGHEFHVYETYVDLVLEQSAPLKWVRLCSKLPLHTVANQSLEDCIKYVFHCLLIDPFYHFIYYCNVLKILSEKSEDEDDRELLRQSAAQLNVIRSKTELDKKLSFENYLHNKDCGNTRWIDKMDEIQKSIDGWEGKNINQLCNQFITEGFLSKVSGKRQSERYCFLLDGLIIFTKKTGPQAGRRSVSIQGTHVYDYKLKEKFLVRNVDVVDREDSEDVKNSFEIISQHQSQQSHVVMAAKTPEEKIRWLSALFKLFNRSMLARMLDTRLKEEDKQQPLQLPSIDIYRFAEEDSDENILFEDQSNESSLDIPIIKGGTLLKLVARLTYHSYYDPKFNKTFLTTYRTFTHPQELLCLLIERFNIPEVNGERDHTKKYHNLFIKPITFRVLNVIRQWLEHHWYDFEDNQPLIDQLSDFLNTSIKSKALKKWVQTIKKLLKRELEQEQQPVKKITFTSNPPAIEWHLETNPQLYDFMNLHPIEIARQQTLLEFEVFQRIKSSEMVGRVWTKADKRKTSPNLLQMIHLTTKFTFMLEKTIVETENFEERVAVVTRTLEMLLIFQELNNFNGIFEVHSALNSASIYRLKHTFEEINRKTPKLMRALEEVKELTNNHFKGYMEKLRSINPPCLPFLGMYLTNILKLEGGNPDFLPKKPPNFINFSKRRKVTEITSEIQQYQNQPYCLSVEESIKNYLLSLNPMEDRSEENFETYLFEQSLKIEPRQSKPAKFERKREFSLKSPGTKSTSTAVSYRPPHHPSSNRSNLHYKGHPSSGNLPSDDSHGGESNADSGRATPRTPKSPTSSSSPHYSPGDDVTKSCKSSVTFESNPNSWQGSTSTVNTIASHRTMVHQVLGPSPPPRTAPRSFLHQILCA